MNGEGPSWWDACSNQPYKLAAEDKLRPGAEGVLEYLEKYAPLKR